MSELQELSTTDRHEGTIPFTFTNTKLKHIDYVLAYKKSIMEKHPNKKANRIKFETALQKQDIQIDESESLEDPDIMYVKVCVPFERLCQEAESIGLQMPIDECIVYDDQIDCFEAFENKCFVTDNEEDFVSAPFFRNKFHMYEGHEDTDTFFRTALRIYLTHHIMIRTDIRDRVAEEEDKFLSKKALPHLLMRGVYIGSIVIHDPSKDDPYNDRLLKSMTAVSAPPINKKANLTEEERAEKNKEREKIIEGLKESLNFTYEPDKRQDLYVAWKKLCAYQPMWKIRNYFGEKIAFYFSWSGHLITYLWLPTILGLIVFTYGLYASVRSNMNKVTNTTIPTSSIEQVVNLVDDMLSIVKEAFDNTITPFYALLICLWGTLFTETWKRLASRLSYEWDVDQFSDSEPDRAQFVGTTARRDPVTNEEDYYYPMKRQAIKFAASLMILLIMIVVVLISVAAVVVYRVFVTVKVCPTVSSTECLCLNMILSSLMNAVFIVILGKVYELLAYKLTDWENHRTQSSYDDGLIIKLFAFQFANSYSSLFYIAFFRGNSFFISQEHGLFGLGSEYLDTCGSSGNCMSMLSFQVMILMLVKPMPKLFKDIFVPLIKQGFRNCIKQCRKSKVDDGEVKPRDPQDIHAYIDQEFSKPGLEDFTIPEYMEKVIQYGFLMLFTASFPLAPLFAILTNIFDLLVDGRRMIWMYQRPIPFIVPSIGMWEGIVEFVNICGVISNALIIAFTSNWGKQFSREQQLIMVLGIEHAVFLLKYFIGAVIPDVPRDIRLNMRREKFQVNQILERGNISQMKTPGSTSKAGKALRLECDIQDDDLYGCNVHSKPHGSGRDEIDASNPMQRPAPPLYKPPTLNDIPIPDEAGYRLPPLEQSDEPTRRKSSDYQIDVKDTIA